MSITILMLMDINIDMDINIKVHIDVHINIDCISDVYGHLFGCHKNNFEQIYEEKIYNIFAVSASIFVVGIIDLLVYYYIFIVFSDC